MASYGSRVIVCASELVDCAIIATYQDSVLVVAFLAVMDTGGWSVGVGVPATSTLGYVIGVNKGMARLASTLSIVYNVLGVVTG